MKHNYEFIYKKELTVRLQNLLRQYCCYDLCRVIDKGYLIKELLEDDLYDNNKLIEDLIQLNFDYEENYREYLKYILMPAEKLVKLAEPANWLGRRNHFMKLVNQTFLDKIEERMEERVVSLGIPTGVKPAELLVAN